MKISSHLSRIRLLLKRLNSSIHFQTKEFTQNLINHNHLLNWILLWSKIGYQYYRRKMALLLSLRYHSLKTKGFTQKRSLGLRTRSLSRQSARNSYLSWSSLIWSWLSVRIYLTRYFQRLWITTSNGWLLTSRISCMISMRLSWWVSSTIRTRSYCIKIRSWSSTFTLTS